MDKIKLDRDTKYALEGRIVTLDKNSTIFDTGIIFIEGDRIVDVRKRSNPMSFPDGFTQKDVIKTGGTIYPGLIELHNHLSYNIVPMWMVPKPFEDRDQWRRHKDYRKKMTGPLKVLGGIDGYLQAIVRYVECKLLFSGVTSSQGITLASHGNIIRYYKGIVRNVEQTVDDDLPDARTRIGDIKKPEKLLKMIEKDSTTCYLLHLAEGVHSNANKHFRALQISADKWAINEKLAGIHSVGLMKEDFGIMGRRKGTMVWSPMSNFMLYGITADVVAAKDNEMVIGLGSDWSASGSKNLLCELKVAKIYSQKLGNIFSDEELIRMATTNAAEILKWDKAGSLQAGHKADLIVLRGDKQNGDPYDRLIKAREQDVSFVVIDGWPRLGYKKFMKKFDVTMEMVKVGSLKRYLNLTNEIENPIDIGISYSDAVRKLTKGLRRLPQLAREAELSDRGVFRGAAGATQPHTSWRIFPEHEDHLDTRQRHHLPFENKPTGGSFVEMAAVLLSEILQPMELDPPNIANDKLYFKKLAVQKNLPEYLKLALPEYYGQKIDLSETDNFIKTLKSAVKNSFDSIQTLSKFYDSPGYLSRHNRFVIIDQATVLLEQAYVHLRLKEVRHASNPLQRLKILRQRLEDEESYPNEISFHKEMIDIFNSLRDLHTTYQLPEPFNDKVAFLPFLIEEFFVDGEPKYLISRLIGKSPSKSFKKGVEVTHWNSVPIKRAIKLNGNRYAGSNLAARFARGLDTMTFRPLAMMLPPEEDWVEINYLNGRNKQKKISFPWMVGSVYSHIFSPLEDSSKGDFGLSWGFDHLGCLVQAIKKAFFAPKVLKAETVSAGTAPKMAPGKKFKKTSFPGHFKARTFVHNGKKIGYIRIYSFVTSQPENLAQEFARLIAELSNAAGVILDVRNNGGGNILAAEWMLQSLTKQNIRPQPAQFVNTELVEDLCRLHSPSAEISGFDLSKWLKSINEIRLTGSAYTLGYPITPSKSLKSFRPQKNIDLLLITDALCYSATDIFAAGFKDHKIGTVLGVHGNTGAGGANVWTHSLLNRLTMDSEGTSKYFESLPYGANFTIAVRRTLRVKSNAGIPLEDLGVKPDEVYRMTKDDLLHNNRDLISRACALIG
jgi:C-terminal processing protease CtpA/Prc